MIVVDASVIATALGDDGDDGAAARAMLMRERLVAPDLIDLEVASAWRRAEREGRLTERRARQAIDDLIDLPLERVRDAALLPRIWELRHNLTPYDAAYVAVAEALEAPLVTADRGLAKAPGTRCETRLLT